MHRSSRILVTLATILLAGTAAAAPPSGRTIVVLDDSADPRAVAAAEGLAPHHVYTEALRGFSVNVPAQALAGLTRNPHVLWIEEDTEAHATEQTVPTGIRRSGAGALLDGGAIDVDIAIIDTGIDATNPDLNVVSSANCTRVDRAGNCATGGADDHGHGTHVAGTAAARDDDAGVVGMAPGARLWAVKVLDRNGNGWTSDVIAGVNHVKAHANEIDVANMSLGGAGTDDTDGGDCAATKSAYHKAVCGAVGAGVTFVVAAGNERADASTSFPAAFDEVITVSALADFDGVAGGLAAGTFAFSSCTESEDDSFACFSNFGHDVDILAPGVGILSTLPGGLTGSKSGTSMASPHVAGAAGRVIAASAVRLSPAEVQAALLAGARPGPCGASPGGACADDPDGTDEPMVWFDPPGCASDAACADADPCTVDACDPGTGECSNLPAAEGSACGEGGLCCAGACVPPACGTDAECGASDECTSRTCTTAGTCAAHCVTAAAADGQLCTGGLCCAGSCVRGDCTADTDCADDGDECTTPACLPTGCGAMACSFVAHPDDSLCADGTGICCGGACAAAACASDTDCADPDFCTAESCALPGTCQAACVSSPAHEAEVCGADPGGACCDGSCTQPACTDAASCDDADACTVELCENAGDACAAGCVAAGWVACDLADGCCAPGCTATDPDCPAMRVGSIVSSLTTTKKAPRYTIASAVTIVDRTGGAVASAAVTVEVRAPDGTTTNVQATTDANGLARPTFRSNLQGTYATTVTGVSHASLAWAPAPGDESCQGLTVPTGVEVACP